ncbi:MAG: porin family protein [Flavisolibacter sp.]
MKKAVFLVLITFSLAAAQAQMSGIGVKAGLNLSSITNRDMKPGYHVGFLAHLRMGQSWALQPEVVYSNQGAKYDLSNGETHTLNLNYINIPFLFQYNATPSLRLQTGPQVGFMTSVHDKVGSTETYFFDKNDFKDTDFSWSIGASYVGRGGIGVDARYNIGLSDINEGGGATIKNNVAQIGVFMMLQ